MFRTFSRLTESLQLIFWYILGIPCKLCLRILIYLKVVSSIKVIFIHFYKSDVMFTVFFEISLIMFSAIV